MGSFEIAVAGCGPAGLACALALHRDGHRVRIFERFPEPRAVGSGLMLQPSGMAVLAALGLAQTAARRGAPIASLYGKSADGREVLNARYADLRGPRSFGLGIHRASLFDLLLGAVRAAGIEIEFARNVVETRLHKDRRELVFQDRTRAGPFDLVIDALGIATPLTPATGKILPFGALWATLPGPEGCGFDRTRLEQRYRGAREMVGVLPIGSRPGVGEELALFWSIQGADYPAWLADGLASWRSKVVALWPQCADLVDQIDDPGQLTFARYAHRTVSKPAEARLIHIGDAWHSASPQLGQGANMALLDAWAVAQALRLSRDVRMVPALTVQLRGWHVQLYQWITAFFTPLYQSDAAIPPFVRDHLFAPASGFWPGKQVQALLMSGLFGSPLARLGLRRIDYATL